MFDFDRVLVLAPHTDDAELGCGGTIARLQALGVHVCVAVFSTAEESLPEGSEPGQLKSEFIESMQCLGIATERYHVFDYTVRRLSYHRQEVLDDLIQLRSLVDPELILIPSGSDLHQDHQVVFAEGLRAFKHLSVWGYELPWNHVTFSAQAFVRLEREHLLEKWDALKVYRSQLQLQRPYFSWDFIEGLARVRGVQVRATYAEAFEVVRMRL